MAVFLFFLKIISSRIALLKKEGNFKLQAENIIEMRGIEKQFPGVKALNGVSLYVKKGQIHGLVGENGAGKSTLMKVLSGIYSKDAGEIILNGKKVEFKDALDARKHGIGLVHQEPQIVPSISIAENICLGGLPNNGVFVSKRELMEKSEEYCSYVGINKSVELSASFLSMGEKQLLQFARALFYESKIIIMDEPTSSLTEKEKDHIFSIVRKLQAEGITFLYITHRMEELFEICDEVTVMKDGCLVKSVQITDIDKKGLVNLMVGREVGLSFPPYSEERGKEVLRVEHLTQKGVFEDVSFEVYAGEVLGFGGLVGAGRTEIMDAIFGMSKPDEGKIFVDGREVKISCPKEAIASKIAYVTEDRHGGMVLHASILENMTLASLKMFVKHVLINDRKRKDTAEDFKGKLSIKAPGLYTEVNDLSGGNQQKVIFAKWLMQDAQLYILDEPTRGIDVGAKEEIYKLIRDLTGMGKAVIVISSELPELIGISDRIIVVHNGKISGEVSHEEASENLIIQYATGVINQ